MAAATIHQGTPRKGQVDQTPAGVPTRTNRPSRMTAMRSPSASTNVVGHREPAAGANEGLLQALPGPAHRGRRPAHPAARPGASRRGRGPPPPAAASRRTAGRDGTPVADRRGIELDQLEQLVDTAPDRRPRSEQNRPYHRGRKPQPHTRTWSARRRTRVRYTAPRPARSALPVPGEHASGRRERPHRGGGSDRRGVARVAPPAALTSCRSRRRGPARR